mmetsp:Transcript_164163/g.315392  ORF Transcript_164163/g.315392 Transcript_164163/m.315392 type:complete len:294 (-) Transcript_164163:253-1134(-)
MVWPSCQTRRLATLLNGSEPVSFEQNFLGLFGAQVCVSRLLVHKNTSDLFELSIDLRHLKLNGALANVELLVVLLEHFLVPACLHCWQRNSLVVTSGGTTALRVEKKASAVRGHHERTRHCEAWSNFISSGTCRSNQVLYCEQERDALTTWQLDSCGSIINAIRLNELQLAFRDGKCAFNAIQHICLAGCHLARNWNCLSTLLLRHLLFKDCERCWLQAKVAQLLQASNLDTTSASFVHLWAGVGKAAALDLVIGQGCEIVSSEWARKGTICASREGKKPRQTTSEHLCTNVC